MIKHDCLFGRGAADGNPGGFSGPDNEEWINVIALLRRYKGRWRQMLTDDAVRIRVQFLAVYIILGTVSLGMTVLNVFTSWAVLGYVTFAFFVLSFINCALCMVSKTLEKLSHALFAVEMISLFAFFAVVGNPEGFSILWSVLLPTCGLLLFRAKAGSILALGQWLVLVFLFWTHIGRGFLMYSYTESFLQRYPLLYMACYFVGFLFEFIRGSTHEELVLSRQQFEFLSRHDVLTGLYNRSGLKTAVENMISGGPVGIRASSGRPAGSRPADSGPANGRPADGRPAGSRPADSRPEGAGSAADGRQHFAFAIADLDHFKRVNDLCGHPNGDKVLRRSAEIINDTVGSSGYVCRWGGEEFSIVFFDDRTAEDICRNIITACGKQEYDLDGNHIICTISIGLVTAVGSAFACSSQTITQADANLYISKTSGRNCLTASAFREALAAR